MLQLAYKQRNFLSTEAINVAGISFRIIRPASAVHGIEQEWVMVEYNSKMGEVARRQGLTGEMTERKAGEVTMAYTSSSDSMTQ